MRTEPAGDAAKVGAAAAAAGADRRADEVRVDVSRAGCPFEAAAERGRERQLAARLAGRPRPFLRAWMGARLRARAKRVRLLSVVQRLRRYVPGERGHRRGEHERRGDQEAATAAARPSGD